MPTGSLIKFEDGKRQLEKKLAIIEKKKKKATTDDLLQKGVPEMEEDQKKDPSQRAGYVGLDFYEEYEVDSTAPTEEPQPEQQEKPSKSSAKKKKLKGKRKRSEEPKEEVEEDSRQKADIETKVVKKKKMTTKIPEKEKKEKKILDRIPSKKKKKKSLTASEAGNDTEKPAENFDGEKEASGNTNAPTAAVASAVEKNDATTTEIIEPSHENRSPQSKQRLSAYEEYVMALGEVSSHGDSNDGEFDGVSDDDAAADQDFPVSDQSKTKKTKTMKTAPAGEKAKKERPKKKASTAKVKIEKRPKGEKKAPTNESLRKAEQKRFEMCEQNYAALIRRWEKAIDNEDADQISRVYGALLSEIDKFTPSFMEVYNLNGLMKLSKQIVNNEKRKEVMAKLKETYTSKKAKVPEGFKAVKKSERILSASNTKLESDTPEAKISDKPEPEVAINKEEETAATKQEEASESQDLLTAYVIPRSGSKLEDLDSACDPTRPMKSEPTSQPHSQKQQAPVVNKPEKKKKFSLGKLMRPSSVQSLSDAKPTSSIPRESSEASLQASKSQSVPTWTLHVIETEPPSDENRQFALEFLQQAVPHIPEGKNINYDAIARNLELSIFKWANGNESNGSHRTITLNGHHSIEGNGKTGQDRGWVDKYWNKIHDLVAAISGKDEEGTLAGMIAEGKFRNPIELITLPDDDLWRSFQSQPLASF
jgi:hypothetical protein